MSFTLSILALTFAALAGNPPSPQICWNIESASTNVADSCGAGTASLTMLTSPSPECDISGCRFASNTGFYSGVPSGIASDWTILMWYRGSTNYLQTLFVMNNFMATAVAYSLQVEGDFLRFTKLSTNYNIMIGADWLLERWVGIYMYSTSTSSGFGAYVPNYIGGGPYFSLDNNFEMRLYQFVNIPNYKFRFGTDLSGNNPANLIREINIYFTAAYHQSSSPFTIQDLLNCKFLLIPEKDCPNLVRTNYFSCSALWAHYKLDASYISPDTQVIYDLSGNGNSASNGDNSGDTTDDGIILNTGGMQFDGTQYIKAPSISGAAISYAYAIKATINPSVLNRFQDSGSLLVKYLGGTFRFLTGGNFLDNTCGPLIANTEYLFAFTVLKQDASLTYLSLFIDGALCISDNILATMPPIDSSRLVQIDGVATEIWIFKVVLGAESFRDPTLIVSCPVGQYYDSASDSCQDCDFRCSACNGPLNSQCIICASPAILLGSSTCICPSTHFTDTLDQVCSLCSTSCLTCSGPSDSDCLSCAAQPTLVGSTCVCDNNYTNNGGICQCPENLNPDGICEGCGDALLQHYQQCDDGNALGGDGCNQECSLEDGFQCTQLGSGKTQCTLILTLAIERTLLVQENNSIIVHLYLNRRVTFSNFQENDVALTFRGLQDSQRSTEIVSKSGVEDSVIEIIIRPNQSIQTDEVVSQYLDVAVTTGGAISSNESFLDIPSQLVASDLAIPQFDFITTSEEAAAQIFAPLIESIFGSELVLSTLGRILLQMAMQPLWCAVDVNQLIFFIPGINVALPRNAMIFFKALSFFTGDFYPFQLGYEHTLGQQLPPSMSSPFSSSFDILGYESSSIIQNCGVAFCILLSLLLLMGFFKVLAKVRCCKCS